MNLLKLFLVFFFVPLPLLAQNINNLSVDDGLPQSFVSGIVEDNYGFIWISTLNGLARFDGNNFKIFQSVSNENDAIASNRITSLKKIGGDSMWIRYQSGEIDRFYFDTEKVDRVITQDIINNYDLNISRREWLVTADNTLWFKNRKRNLISLNLNGIEKSKGYVKRCYKEKDVYNLLEDKNKILWILEKTGISFFNPESKQFEQISFPSGFEFSADTSSGTIAFCERNNGELMWADNKRLYFFDKKNSSFRIKTLPAVSQEGIRHIYIGKDDKEYFKSGSAIYSYDDTQGIVFLANIALKNNREEQAFLVDQTGLIWIGSDAEGVYTIDCSLRFKSSYNKEDFIIDVIKETFAVSPVEFFNWEVSRKGVLQPSYVFRSVWEEEKQWMTLDRTVGYYSKKTKKIIKLPELPILSNRFSPIVGISIEKNDLPVVIDKNKSLYVFNNQENKWEDFLPVNFLTNKFGSNITVNNIYIDKSDDVIWIATEEIGLIGVNLTDYEVIQFMRGVDSGFPTNNLIDIVPDVFQNEILWIGSSAGLIQFNKNSHKAKVFSIREGLPDNVIYSILTDKQGNLWMGTNKGLVCFNTKTFKSRIFTKNHGLKNIEFNRFHKFLFPDGKMAFGGSVSWVSFLPEDIKEDTFSPNVAINEIKINNKLIDLNLPVNKVKGLKLPYFENTISFAYTALQYSQPDDIKYRYQLLGYDDGWIVSGSKRDAIYTKLPPGKYTFQVNASNTTGKWSNNTKNFLLEITPPWWETWWAILLYVIIAVSILIIGIRFKIHQEVIKNKIRFKEKEIEELRKLDKVKIRFFSNIAHELRTPLSLILGPAEQLRNDNEFVNKKVDIIHKNTISLINLTDQLLDMAKLEAGVLKPNMVWGDVILFISSIIDTFREESISKQVTITLKAPATAEFLFSINTVERILYNLLSNSLKFTRAGDSITVIVSKKENGLYIAVEDTGIGVPPEEQDNIFKRYYKGTNQDGKKGTGIGLSLVHELVELHQGTIVLESNTKEVSGTKILIYLPFESYTLPSMGNSGVDTNSNEKQTVLIVEDHPELLTFIKESLEQSYNIITAQNGKEALDQALNLIPDIIVSDVAMEQMDGFEFCKAVKQNININHIPVILLTAKIDLRSRLEGLSFGANDYLTKPFSISELRLRIGNLLGLQKMQQDYFYRKFTESSDEEIENTEEPLYNEFLQKIHNIIDENIDNRDFGVDQLAEALFMSRSTLHRKVKTLFGISGSEIIKIYRLKKAAKLLREDYNVSEVTDMTGFNTPSYFSKCFKEYFHVTPAKYKQNSYLQRN